MSSVKGKWVFNEILTFSEFFEMVNFTSNSTKYYQMSYYNPDMADYVLSYDESGGGDYITVNYSSNAGQTQEWQNQAYRTVDFGTTEQEVSDEFLTWMQANATPESTSTDAVTITYKDTIILAESGKTVTLSTTNKKLTGDIIITAPEEEIIEEWDGSYSILSDIELISFTIAGTTYQAEAGMTWYEWCNSNYNTYGYNTGNESGMLVMKGTGGLQAEHICKSASGGFDNCVVGTGVIDANGVYYHYLYAPGGN